MSTNIDQSVLRQLIKDHGTEVTEILKDLRKGVPQSKYVVELSGEAEYWSDSSEGMVCISPEYTGFWMMNVADDLRYYPVSKYDNCCDWVRAKEVSVVTTEWQEVEEQS